MSLSIQQNYEGTDSFSFKANDGKADSNIGIVRINVAGEGTAPIDTNGTISTPMTPKETETKLTSADEYSFVRTRGSLGSGYPLFSSPVSIAIDSVGNVYVSDNYYDRI